MTDARVHATPAVPAPAIRQHRMCIECGNAVMGAGSAEFCAAACRHAFNNRRKSRGAEFYDLYMAHRFDRKAATAAKVISLMNRLASNFHREDEDVRGGRRSWRPLKAVLADHPSLRAVVVWRGRRKKDVKA